MNENKKISKEKKAVLVLYGISLAMALAIFVYLTRVKGYTPNNDNLNLLELILINLLPVLAVYFIGAIIIWKRYGSKPEEVYP